MAGLLECVGESTAAAVGATLEGYPDDDSIVTVGLRPADRLEVDRYDAHAVLPGALGDELLRPGPEGHDVVVGQERQLVAAGAGQCADRDPQRHARIRVRFGIPARAEHRPSGRQQRVEIQPDQ